MVTDYTSRRENERSITWNRLAVNAAFFIGCLILGALPFWLKFNAIADQREASQRELALSHMQNTLSSALIDAWRGEYESARQTTSDFFWALRIQVDRQDDGHSLTRSQRENLRPLLSERDEIVNLLADNDPIAIQRLSSLYEAYRKILKNAGKGS